MAGRHEDEDHAGTLADGFTVGLPWLRAVRPWALAKAGCDRADVGAGPSRMSRGCSGGGAPPLSISCRITYTWRYRCAHDAAARRQQSSHCRGIAFQQLHAGQGLSAGDICQVDCFRAARNVTECLPSLSDLLFAPALRAVPLRCSGNEVTYSRKFRPGGHSRSPQCSTFVASGDWLEQSCSSPNDQLRLVSSFGCSFR